MRMSTRILVVLFAGLALLVSPVGTLGDHIPNHDNCDDTFPMPIPGQEHFDGGLMFVNLIGPVDDHVITNTTFDITYVSDGATSASDLLLHGFITVDGGTSDFTVTGADLGFGSGPGTFTGTYETDALNGVADAQLLLSGEGQGVLAPLQTPPLLAPRLRRTALGSCLHGPNLVGEIPRRVRL